MEKRKSGDWSGGQLQEEQQVFSECRRRDTNACVSTSEISLIYNHSKCQSGCSSVIKGVKKLYIHIQNVIQQ